MSPSPRVITPGHQSHEDPPEPEVNSTVGLIRHAGGETLPYNPRTRAVSGGVVRHRYLCPSLQIRKDEPVLQLGGRVQDVSPAPFGMPS